MVDGLIPRAQDFQSSELGAQRIARAARIKESAKDDKEKPVAEQRAAARPDSAPEEPHQEVKPTEEELAREIERLNAILGHNTSLRFRVGKSTGDLVVEIVDKETNEVIKTIPPSEIRNVASKINLEGVLIDNKS